MLRLLLVIAAVAVVALPSLDGRAQGKDKDKDKAKLKLCAAGGGNSALPRDRCVEQKTANTPTQLQIGRSSFGSGGSTFKGGATGGSLKPAPTGRINAPLGGSVKAK